MSYIASVIGVLMSVSLLITVFRYHLRDLRWFSDLSIAGSIIAQRIIEIEPNRSIRHTYTISIIGLILVMAVQSTLRDSATFNAMSPNIQYFTTMAMNICVIASALHLYNLATFKVMTEVSFNTNRLNPAVMKLVWFKFTACGVILSDYLRWSSLFVVLLLACVAPVFS